MLSEVTRVQGSEQCPVPGKDSVNRSHLFLPFLPALDQSLSTRGDFALVAPRGHLQYLETFLLGVGMGGWHLLCRGYICC